MICRSVQPRTGSTNIVRTRRHKGMGSVSDGRHLEVAREGTGQSVLGTCIREFRGDGCSWNVVWIERAGGLAFDKLGFNL